ncbi:YoaK family protein [Streptomyces sp. NPDC059176]|uniref:YoaK family protein n=1 Tax=unclassified Streptomyces TaxID=2593676 RepID=UPI003683C78B
MLSKRLDRVGPPAGLMVLLTAVAGWVDAAAYTGPSRVFVANQTGNAVFLVTRLTERALLHPAGRSVEDASGPLASICGFCAGVLLAALLVRRSLRKMGRAWTALAAGRWFLLVVEAALLVAAATSAPDLDQVPVVLIAAAMGVQSLYAARVALQGVPTTTLTNTLVTVITRAVQDRGRAARRGVRLLFLVFLAYMIGAAGGAAVTLGWSYSAAHAIAAVLLAASAAAMMRGGLPGTGTGTADDGSR